MTADASNSERPRALVFDVDGTLIDTLAPMAQALNESLATIGRPPWDLPRVRGRLSLGLDGLLAAALQAGGGLPECAALDRLRTSLLQRYQALAPGLSRCYPGADDLLRQARQQGCRLAICSNASGPALHDLLDHVGWLTLFDSVIHADNMLALKPSGLPLQQVLAALDLAPSQAWMIGDSALDAGCAQAAGCPFVWFSGGYGAPTSTQAVHARVDDHAALSALIPHWR
jgi:phosphoglycolate phosphatase